MLFPEQGIPVIAAIALRLESKDWSMRGVTPDEASYRYVYRKTLERFGLDCPHPLRNDMSRYIPGAYECRMCLCYMVPA